MIYVIHWFVNILTLGLVSIATITTTTYHVDEPITELNNQSLNEVFLDGNMILNHDFSDGLNNWIIVSSPTITLYDTYVEIYNSTGSGYARIEQRPNVSVGDKTYVTINAKSTGGDRLQYYNGSNLILNVSNEFQQLSGLSVAATQTDTYYQLGIIVSVDTLTILKGSIYAINVTDLGIDNLTQAQLDYWFDIYVQAVANNGVYIESTSHLNNNIHLVDVSVMVISFGLWTWLIKFLKGVII